MSERWNLRHVGESSFAEEEVGDFCRCHRSEHRTDVDSHIEKAETVVAERAVFCLVVEVSDHDLKITFEETCSYRDECECREHGDFCCRAHHRDSEEKITEEHDYDAGSYHFTVTETVGEDTTDERHKIDATEEDTVDLT